MTETDWREQEHMKCMEIWGGSGVRDCLIRRPGLDIWTSCVAHERETAGGGNLYLVSSCASGRITRMLLADICALATPFSQTADELRNVMKRNINVVGQARAMKGLTRHLENATSHGVFAATLLCTYFAPTRSFKLSNAGHPPPLVFRAADQSWSTLRPLPNHHRHSPSESGMVGRDDSQELETRLEQGDMVLIFSSSLADCQNANGTTIGTRGVLDRVQRYSIEDPDRIGNGLLKKIRGEHSNNLSRDDATLMLCRATNNRVRWQDNLLAPARLFTRARDVTTLG